MTSSPPTHRRSSLPPDSQKPTTFSGEPVSQNTSPVTENTSSQQTRNPSDTTSSISSSSVMSSPPQQDDPLTTTLFPWTTSAKANDSETTQNSANPETTSSTWLTATAKRISSMSLSPTTVGHSERTSGQEKVTGTTDDRLSPPGTTTIADNFSGASPTAAATSGENRSTKPPVTNSTKSSAGPRPPTDTTSEASMAYEYSSTTEPPTKTGGVTPDDLMRKSVAQFVFVWGRGGDWGMRRVCVSIF